MGRKTDGSGKGEPGTIGGERTETEEDADETGARGAEGAWSLESLWVTVAGTLPERIEREAPLTDKTAGAWMRKRLQENNKE